MIANRQTIVAVSSPPGRSARGLVRVSGGGVLEILGGLLAPPQGAVNGVRAWPVAGRVVPWQVRLSDGEAGLGVPALVGYMKGPRTYTGQDVAEVQVPGSPALLGRVVARVVGLGARLAEPGEFTFRAFLAGKMDLTQAEGVAATIAAESSAQLRAAAALVGGGLRGFAEDVVARLSDALALVEAGIDFIDQEDVVPIGPGALDARLLDIEGQLVGLLGRCRSWGALDALPRVVLVGRPSAGKSTLFNALLGRRRAVVAEQEGTTRDVLEEVLELQTDQAGSVIEVMLVDLAGLYDAGAGAGLDRQVQEMARRAVARADVVLYVDDGRTPRTPHPPDSPLPPAPPHSPSSSASVVGGLDAPAAVFASAATADAAMVRVRTKTDLLAAGEGDGDWDVAVCATDGTGLDRFREAIVRAVGRREVGVGGEVMALQPRHESAVRGGLAAVRRARGLLKDQVDQRGLSGVELVAAALRDGLDEIAGLGGRMTPDDVIGRVFSTFCVGK